jgi:hypothetical protein
MTKYSLGWWALSGSVAHKALCIPLSLRYFATVPPPIPIGLGFTLFMSYIDFERSFIYVGAKPT